MVTVSRGHQAKQLNSSVVLIFWSYILNVLVGTSVPNLCDLQQPLLWSCNCSALKINVKWLLEAEICTRAIWSCIIIDTHTVYSLFHSITRCLVLPFSFPQFRALSWCSLGGSHTMAVLCSCNCSWVAPVLSWHRSAKIFLLGKGLRCHT